MIILILRKILKRFVAVIFWERVTLVVTQCSKVMVQYLQKHVPTKLSNIMLSNAKSSVWLAKKVYGTHKNLRQEISPSLIKDLVCRNFFIVLYVATIFCYQWVNYHKNWCGLH